jgi:serine/threonine protein kinase
MELVEGETLRQKIGDRRCTLDDKLRWLDEVASALDAAHAKNVVHRDVKPDNVLVSDDGPAKVLDFGIARRVDNEEKAIDPSAPTEAGAAPIVTAPGTLLGTPSYMAPEQLHGEQVDGRTDQFAWGVLAFELLSGRSPWRVRFEGPSAHRVDPQRRAGAARRRRGARAGDRLPRPRQGPCGALPVHGRAAARAARGGTRPRARARRGTRRSIARPAGILAQRRRARGPDFGIFSCSKATNEVNYLAQKFIRIAIGSQQHRQLQPHLTRP